MNNDNFLANLQNIDNMLKSESNLWPEGFENCREQYYNPAPITNTRLAHSYVPFQYLECLYPVNTALKQGTIFPELDRPYVADPIYTIDA